MMDVNSLSTSEGRSALNQTEEIGNRLNLNVPGYLYREIPSVFEAIGVILNMAIIIYFIKSRKYRNPIFTILTSLAAMDTCVCLGGFLTVLIAPTVLIPNTGFMCLLAMCVVITGILGSEYTLIFFAGVRLYQVITPLKAKVSITMSLVLKYCATIITISVGLSILYAVFWRPETIIINGEDITVCTFIADKSTRDQIKMIIITVIPCFTIFLIHVLKYCAYVGSKSLLVTNEKRKTPDAHVVAIVIFLFYICWIPGQTYVIIQHFRRDDYVPIDDKVFIVLIHVLYANSIMNPLVYVLAMKSIRDDVIKLFCFARQENPK